MLNLRRLAVLGAAVFGLGIGAAQALPVSSTVPAAQAAAVVDGGSVQKATYGYGYPSWHYGPKWGGYRSYDRGYRRGYSYGYYPRRSYSYGYYPRYRAYRAYRPYRAYRNW